MTNQLRWTPLLGQVEAELSESASAPPVMLACRSGARAAIGPVNRNRPCPAFSPSLLSSRKRPFT